MASTSMVGGTPGRGGTRGLGRGTGRGRGPRRVGMARGRGDHAESEPAGAALEGRSLQDARTGRGSEVGGARGARAARPLTPRLGWRRSSCANQGSVAGTRRDPGVDRTVPEGTRANA